jgi:hypothetical protein
MGAPPCMVNEGKNQSQPVKLEWNSMEKTWKSTLEVYWNEWDNMGNKTQLTGLMEMIKHQMWNMSLQCNIVYRDSTFCGNKVFGCADWDRGYSLAISDYTITSQNSSVASSTPAVKNARYTAQTAEKQTIILHSSCLKDWAPRIMWVCRKIGDPTPLAHHHLPC